MDRASAGATVAALPRDDRSTLDDPLDRAVVAAHRHRPALRRVSGASLVAATAVLAAADALIWATDPVIDTGRLSISLAVLVPILGALAVLAVALRPRRPVAALVALAAASLGLTALSVVLDSSLPPSLAVVLALGLLTVAVLRDQPGRPAAMLAALAGAAVAAEALRPQVASAAYLLAAATAAFSAAVGVGLYLRWSDWQRAAVARAARTEERLEIARELHDLVGNHLTGIVVQAQAARHVADRHPDAAALALERIGSEGTEALEAMRWMVGALRDHTDLGAGWADVERLAAFATAPGLEVTASLAPGTPALLDHQAPVAYRVVAEALTNARRHARGVTRIAIEAQATAEHLVLTVTDDGCPVPLSPTGGGSGLAELRRRVADLGGSLTAGPIGSGTEGGWMVRAELPRERSR